VWIEAGRLLKIANCFGKSSLLHFALGALADFL
jgi:hypothetical protein